MAASKLNRGRSQKSLEERLACELQRLKDMLRMGYELEVKWLPNPDQKLSGEVKGSRIYIYEEDEAKALRTLKHEFLDFGLSSAIEPYKAVTNRLIGLINEEAYRRKEKLVEALTKLL